MAQRKRAERSSIVTAAGRARLKVRREPYWAALDDTDGAHVGYRAGPSTWVVRYRIDGRRHYGALGKFEDHRDAFRAARDWIEQWHRAKAAKNAPPPPPTVRAACEGYIDSVKAVKGARVAQEARSRLSRTVLGRTFKTRTIPPHPIAEIPLDALTPKEIEQWRNGLIKPGLTGDELRKARASANREYTSLIAALNRALRDPKVTAAQVWKSVEKYTDVQAREHGRVLTVAERRALLAACEGAVRDLLEGLMLIGARPIELVRANVADYTPSAGSLVLRSYKGKVKEARARTVPLRALGADALIARLAQGRPADAPLFPRPDGQRWQHSGWDEDVRAAAKRAGLAGVTAYTLRHTFITDAITNDVPLLTVARIVGTGLAQIDRTYGHLKGGDELAQAFGRMERP